MSLANAIIQDWESLVISEGLHAGQPMVVLDWQSALAEWIEEFDTIALTMARGNGKAVSLDTPIRTTDGWTTMGELREGQFVFGLDGKPTHVRMVHDVIYDRKCYRVDFSCRESIVADADHLWWTEQRSNGGWRRERRKR